MNIDDKQAVSPRKGIEPLFIVGLFLGVFGLTILIAIFFTPTLRGKITNLVCGSIIVLTALAAIIKSWLDQKRQ